MDDRLEFEEGKSAIIENWVTYVSIVKTPQERDNKSKVRRGRKDRSHSAHSRDPEFIQKHVQNIIFDYSEEQICKDDSSKEQNHSKRTSIKDVDSHHMTEEVMFAAKDYTDNQSQMNHWESPLKEGEKLLDLDTAQLSSEIDLDKSPSEMPLIQEIKETPSQSRKSSLEKNSVSETRIRIFEGSEVKRDRQDNQLSSASKNEQLDSSCESVRGTTPEKEESKSNPEKEGEGDILDTIMPLEIECFLDRKRPKAKNFSESNYDNL